ncbi:hypothetical protein ONZ45_g13705 [Pleurotus djamor]|nr:hypothetical protein ONZ45_g13705 [Pleurotus djamor]
MPPSTGPSANWLSLKKSLAKTTKSLPKKRRKLVSKPSEDVPVAGPSRITLDARDEDEDNSRTRRTTTGDDKLSLKGMVVGDLTYTEQQKLPGKYLALDCEMVGIGLDGSESSLARVSLVNYYGVVQLDEFVRQRERVVDYRTQYSGIRPSDMAKAKPFEDIQTLVAGLLKDRILVGHAVLLLSHPRPQTVDTQYYAWKYKVTKSKYAALRNLVKQELDMSIQEGEHSSVTDARATMALFRLHKHEWEKNLHPVINKKKRKREDVEDEDNVEESDVEASAEQEFPGGGRKGVSSGLSTIVRRKGKAGSAPPRPSKTKKGWWKDLGTGTKS